MLFTRHPARQPASAVRRHATPELAVQFRQPQAITTGHVLPAAVREDEIAAGSRPDDAGIDATIHFAVTYRLREYLALLGEHIPAGMLQWEQARSGRPRERLSTSTRLAIRLLLPLIGAPVFLLKKRRMPVCRFTIDARGIERRTRDGTLRVAWADVVAVHRYRQAWLVDPGRGGLPIPYRCLDDGQRAAFERLLRRHVGADTPI